MPLENWFSSLSSSISGLKSQTLRSRLLNDPYHRFQSIEEIRLAAQLGIGIDVNQASVDDWLRLPGISIHQARTLAALNQTGIQFNSLEDIAAALNLPLQRLKPLEPILQFYYYDAQNSLTPQKVSPNTASIECLSQVPGIDLFLARAIAENRKTNGIFNDLAELQQRLNLSSQLTAKLMHYLKF
jgi:DNA uptake protein ComE-like DNA-binding protein